MKKSELKQIIIKELKFILSENINQKPEHSVPDNWYSVISKLIDSGDKKKIIDFVSNLLDETRSIAWDAAISTIRTSQLNEARKHS